MELTGRHVFAIFGLGFGTIVAVNLALAVNAVRTFPGLEVANSYVASQGFDAERARQRALGWQVAAEAAGDAVRVAIVAADGRPVQGAELRGVIGRPTTRDEDRALDFALRPGGWEAPARLGPGRWLLRLDARAADGTPFRRVIALDGKGA